MEFGESPPLRPKFGAPVTDQTKPGAQPPVSGTLRPNYVISGNRSETKRITLCYLRLAMKQLLRPIERRVLALKASGQTTAEIARRFKRGENHIERIIGWTDIPRRPRERRRDGLRPVERRVLALRNDGLSHEEIGVLFRRDAEFARRVESIAQMRDDLGLLSDT